MTTELEKQFFDTFGIEKIYIWKTTDARKMYGYKRVKAYPQITDRHYLELICIDFANNPYKARGYVKNIEELKNYILEQFIHEFENDLYWNKESVKHQVQAIFKESEQE